MLNELLTIIVPVILVLLVGPAIMRRLSGYGHAEAAFSKLDKNGRKPLNRRCRYDADAVSRHWAPLKKDTQALESAQRYLEIDLIFPAVYGPAIAAALFHALRWLGQAESGYWVAVLVPGMMLSDWIENLVHLRQIRRFAAGDDLQATAIRLASLATLTKLVLFIGTLVWLIWLLGKILVRLPPVH